MHAEVLRITEYGKGKSARSLDLCVGTMSVLAMTKVGNQLRTFVPRERALVVQSAATAVAGHAGTGWHFCGAAIFVGASRGEDRKFLLKLGRTTVRAMGFALPVGGANEKFGVLVASGTGELVDRHGCLGVCRSWIGSVVC